MTTIDCSYKTRHICSSVTEADYGHHSTYKDFGDPFLKSLVTHFLFASKTSL